MRLHSKFYIERDADSQVRRQVVRRGSVITIRASRQSGKSSLMVRGIDYAQQQGAKIVNLDLQRLDKDDLSSINVFLRYIASFIVRKLRLSSDKFEEFWQGPLSAQDKLTFFMEDHVLPEVDSSLVLAIDELDRLLNKTFIPVSSVSFVHGITMLLMIPFGKNSILSWLFPPNLTC